VCNIWPGVFSITVLSITELSMSVLSIKVLSITHLKISRQYHFSVVVQVAAGHQAACIEVIMHQLCAIFGLCVQNAVLHITHLNFSSRYHVIDVIWVAAGHQAACIGIIMHQLCAISGQVCSVSQYSASQNSVCQYWAGVCSIRVLKALHHTSGYQNSVSCHSVSYI